MEILPVSMGIKETTRHYPLSTSITRKMAFGNSIDDRYSEIIGTNFESDAMSTDI